MFNVCHIKRLFIEHQTVGTRRRREYKTILNLGMTSEIYIISGLSFRRIVSFIISEKLVISVARHSSPLGPGCLLPLAVLLFSSCLLPKCLANGGSGRSLRRRFYFTSFNRNGAASEMKGIIISKRGVHFDRNVILKLSFRNANYSISRRKKFIFSFPIKGG